MAVHATKFHENLLSGSKVISEGHTDRHMHTQTHRPAGYLISSLSFFEIRLETK
jgi:hypothetical protein